MKQQEYDYYSKGINLGIIIGLLIALLICCLLFLGDTLAKNQGSAKYGENRAGSIILLDEIGKAERILDRTLYPVVMEVQNNVTLKGIPVAGYYVNDTIVLDSQFAGDNDTIRHELCHHILSTECSTPFGGNMAFEESFCELYGRGRLDKVNYKYGQLNIPKENIKAFLECGLTTCDAKGCFEKYRKNSIE